MLYLNFCEPSLWLLMCVCVCATAYNSCAMQYTASLYNVHVVYICILCGRWGSAKYATIHMYSKQKWVIAAMNVPQKAMRSFWINYCFVSVCCGVSVCLWLFCVCINTYIRFRIQDTAATEVKCAFYVYTKKVYLGKHPIRVYI